MKSIIKGILFGLSLVILNKICCIYGGDFLSVALFFAVTAIFLVSENTTKLLICGFTALFIMFSGEIAFQFLVGSNNFLWLHVYVYGLYGSVLGVTTAFIMTETGKRLNFKEAEKLSDNISKNTKIKLIIYTAISAMGFSYLIMPENAGISIFIFAVLQLVLLWFTVSDRKRLVLFIPICIIALNSFLSASTVWRTSNFLVCTSLTACMFMNWNFRNDSLKYFADIAKNILKPFTCFRLPFGWLLEINSEKAPLIKRIAIATAIALPCAILLILVLSNADMVFSVKAESFMSEIFNSVNLNAILKILCGAVAGLYLCGIICRTYADDTVVNNEKEIFKGDLIIINILLTVILIIYTMFAVIQFKYLFAGAALPEGLSYTEYARKGFFELLALTGVNLAVIFAVVKLTKSYDGKRAFFTKLLCQYLCAVTVVLLVSSFYRMTLYTESDGLTRLRFFVIGFLIFEAAGLLITFFYIAKPKFNITLIYMIIALTYYTVLNVVPADYIIAKNQIEKYLSGERDDLDYIFTLSADAASAMEFLTENTDDAIFKDKINTFLEENTSSDIPERWQRYNLSAENAKKIKERVSIAEN